MNYQANTKASEAHTHAVMARIEDLCDDDKTAAELVREALSGAGADERAVLKLALLLQKPWTDTQLLNIGRWLNDHFHLAALRWADKIEGRESGHQIDLPKVRA